MALVPVRISIAGEEPYSRAFEAFGDEADDLREPLEGVANILREATGRQFETEGEAETGAKWKALNTQYQAEKDERWGPRPILVASGDMRLAFRLNERLPTGQPILELNERRLVWGLDESTPEGERAAWHQGGEGSNPQRKIIALSSETRRSIDREFAEWLARKRASIFEKVKPFVDAEKAA